MAKRILIIDDDVDILELTEMILTTHNFDVFTAVDSKAIDAIDQIRPDLILLDQWLSNENGTDICRKLKAEPATSQIPILIFSALNDLGIHVDDCGAEGYISKPFDLVDFVGKVKSTLGIE